jgi:hypothetical protein
MDMPKPASRESCACNFYDMVAQWDLFPPQSSTRVGECYRFRPGWPLDLDSGRLHQFHATLHNGQWRMGVKKLDIRRHQTQLIKEASTYCTDKID